jgi:hypothetical protein
VPIEARILHFQEHVFDNKEVHPFLPGASPDAFSEHFTKEIGDICVGFYFPFF